MGDGFAFLDIIIFAMVAAFIVLRLRSVLGRRTGHERPPADAMGSNGNVIHLPDHASEDEDGDDAIEFGDDAVSAGLAQVKIADPKFSAAEFIPGAEAAYEMIVEAFAAGELNPVGYLLSDDVRENFQNAIDHIGEDGHRTVNTLVSIKSADVVDAQVAGRVIRLSVKFLSEVLRVERDAGGDVVEGDGKAVREVTEIWTFSHDTRSREPNWVLVETRSAH